MCDAFDGVDGTKDARSKDLEKSAAVLSDAMEILKKLEGSLSTLRDIFLPR